MFYALIYINNDVITIISCMLSVLYGNDLSLGASNYDAIVIQKNSFTHYFFLVDIGRPKYLIVLIFPNNKKIMEI